MTIITEYYSGKPKLINESRSSYKILAQQAESRNQNKRRYPTKVLESEVKRLKPIADLRQLMGELDHTMSEQIALERVSHLITNIFMEGKNVFLEFEILNTPKGLIAKELIAAGIPIGISSRGSGSLLPDKNPGELVVGEDYRAITWDLVADPSVKDARLEISESGKTVTETIRESFNSGTLLQKSFDELILLKDLERKLQDL